MSLPLYDVIKEVTRLLSEFEAERQQRKLPVEFQDPQRALEKLHENWQDLMTACRKRDPRKDGVISSISLAVFAIKYAMDIGQPEPPIEIWSGIEGEEEE